MHPCVGLDNVLSQPSAILEITSVDLTAALDHAVEVAVERHLEATLVHQGAHRVGDVYLVGEDDKALQGAVPRRLRPVAEGEPGEDAIAVGEQQALLAQVAAHCQQSVFLAQPGVRENDFISQLENHGPVPYSS